MSKFKELLSIINEHLEGYTNVGEEEILERIEISYQEDEISGSDYDYLTRLLQK